MDSKEERKRKWRCILERAGGGRGGKAAGALDPARRDEVKGMESGEVKGLEVKRLMRWWKS